MMKGINIPGNETIVPRVSIILLTKNGKRFIGEVLEGIFSQPGRFEVIAVDSGSADGTLEILGRYPVRLIKIKPGEFNHGTTRNLGASMASPGAEFIVFLSQDATPMPGWLDGLLRPMEEDPEVAGVFSRQVPREGGNPILRRYMIQKWGQIGGPERIVKRIAGREDYQRRKKWYTAFSNTSSAVRKEVFDRFPFKSADFAEDRLWAESVLDAGYKIVYEPSSSVLHSHDYTLVEQFRQNFDDAASLAGIEGNSPGGRRRSFGLFRKMVDDAVYIWREFNTLTGRLRWILYIPLWHFATLSGTLLGMNYDTLPAILKRRFSRQTRLKGHTGKLSGRR